MSGLFDPAPARRAVGRPSFAADNAGFQALVLGNRIDPDQVPDLVGSLVVLADSLLPRGSVVSTGTVFKPFNVTAHPAEISDRFLGVELGFRIEVG